MASQVFKQKLNAFLAYKSPINSLVSQDKKSRSLVALLTVVAGHRVSANNIHQIIFSHRNFWNLQQYEEHFQYRAVFITDVR